jgi:CheY-like chemotaxis protein
MTALMMVLLCLAFVGIDLAVRAVSKRMAAAREHRERAAILATSLKLSFAEEARSLKRAEVPNARAAILAVDDEPVVLDSIRRILVLAGFSVDTVENGPEALTLVRARDYDFVFTDLKMPGMDGVEVVKAVKHLRPDVDVAVITGFGTIETAVETMGHGASDYVQKPFTAGELTAFANRLLVKREARLEVQRRPTVRIVTPGLAETIARRDYCVPGGAFVSRGHAWAEIEANGEVCVGLDDFARKALESVERIELPEPGARLRRGDVLFVLRRGEEIARLRAPVSGVVAEVNAALQRHPGLLIESPYDEGWVCTLRPTELSGELAELRIGKPVIAWYQDEIARLRRDGGTGSRALVRWPELESAFFGAGASPAKPAAEKVGA